LPWRIVAIFAAHHRALALIEAPPRRRRLAALLQACSLGGLRQREGLDSSSPARLLGL